MTKGPDDPLDRAFAKVRKAMAALDLPETEEGLWYGTPCFKVRGKSFTRLKDAKTLVLLCPIEEKELLLEAAPHIFFETDHYKGWPAVLARLSEISTAELKLRLERAWRQKAPKTLSKSTPGRSRT